MTRQSQLQTASWVYAINAALFVLVTIGNLLGVME
jgi:hypothetical protein